MVMEGSTFHIKSYFEKCKEMGNSCKVKGAGRQMLAELEKVTASRGRKYIRLDCSDDNPFLNQYYQSQGYEKNGLCQDGPYKGIRREKRVL